MQQKKKHTLFGTDGIRGRSPLFPVQPDIVLKVGQALGYLLRNQPKKKQAPPRVLIGKDTRLSGYMLEQALASGLNSMGVWVQLTGPLPTPGIGFLAQNMRASAGVVISASHNPYFDNGIKIFDDKGFKISHAMEKKIENLVFDSDLNSYTASSDRMGRSRRIDDAQGRYIVHVKNTFPLNLSLDGLKVALDCAHGACYKVVPPIFEELGADVFVTGNKPNGYNINKEVGALCPENIKKEVLKHKAHVGISLDGDGDRLIMVDERGDLVNGDHILGICALNLQAKGELKGNKVVSTYMSGLGLKRMLKSRGIELVCTEVGDRNVVEFMKEQGVVLGGEPSGHVIFLNQNTTGDGCVAALNVLAVMRENNKKLSELKADLKPVPQVHASVPVKTKPALKSIPGYESMIAKIKKEMGQDGRVYVRFSGTEPVLRIFVEGESFLPLQDYVNQIKIFFKKL